MNRWRMEILNGRFIFQSKWWITWIIIRQHFKFRLIFDLKSWTVGFRFDWIPESLFLWGFETEHGLMEGNAKLKQKVVNPGYFSIYFHLLIFQIEFLYITKPITG